MKLLYLDCFAGISGDMLLENLIDRSIAGRTFGRV
jgi:uncharacterized protein (DUF111 family)